MMRQLARPLLISALSLALAVMGIAAASARGQVRAGGEVLVLCSSGGLLQVTLDEDGKPVGSVHLCPDLAMGLIAAFGAPETHIVRPVSPARDAQPVAFAGTAVADCPPKMARGPPVML